MAYGISFVPQGGGQGVPERPPVEPVQEAVKILSLRLPKVLSGAYAPAPLLRSQGSGGNPFANSALGQTQQRVAPPAYQPSPMDQPGPTISGAPSGGNGPSIDPLFAAIQHLSQNRPQPGPVERAPGPSAPPTMPAPYAPPEPPPSKPPAPRIIPGEEPPRLPMPAPEPETPLPAAPQGPSMQDVWALMQQWLPPDADPKDYGYWF